MIEKWFNDDIQKVLSEHRYVVVTDAKGEGEFMMKYLPETVSVLTVSDEWSELEAKYLAETEYADSKVVFYTKRKADKLGFIQEYVQTAGVVVLDDMESYIKTKLFDATGKNTHIGKDKLLLTAKLSEGESLNWWQSVTDGIKEPLELEGWLLDFLNSPSATKQRMDVAVWKVFKSELYRTIGRTETEQPAETMAQEVVNVMFQSIIGNNIDGLLLNTYYHWTDSTERAESLRRYIDNYVLPNGVNPLDVHPDHPFESLDRKVMKLLSDAMKYGKDTAAIVSYIKERTKSKKAKAFKPKWLECVLTVCTFKVEGLNAISNYESFAKYYRGKFAKIDTAMRKIYVAWLNDVQTLRPFQEHYTALNKELLYKWYAMEQSYSPTQLNIVWQALSDNKRTAVIVCDGLRLEIAETIVSSISDRNKNIVKNTAFTVLPSVTENGMSALFGCDEPTVNAQIRFNNLKTAYPDAVIIPLDKLNESITAQKLVLNYGDIDQVGEKKQLGGLKDIDNYESELRNAISMLFRLGYEKVVMTTDHGFVITGILDEADKEPRPDGSVLKIEERYVTTEYPLPANNLIMRTGRYFDSEYQYYAKTDKPFVTRGSYGYAHGGFTPQECIIPVYELTKSQSNIALEVKIANKEELRNIAGNYFKVKLKAEGNSSDLFTNERKVRMMLFAGNACVNTTIYTLKAGEHVEPEFELTAGINKVVVSDNDTAAQIDSCDIRKSSSRDVDDLF